MKSIFRQIQIPEARRGRLIYQTWIASFIFFIVSFILLEISLLIQVSVPSRRGQSGSIALAVISGVLAILTIVLVGSLRIFCARNKITKSYYELLEDVFNSKHFWRGGYTAVSVTSFLSTYISLPLAFVALGMSYGNANERAFLVVSIIAIVLTGYTVAIFLLPIVYLNIKNFFLFHLHGTYPIYERWDHNSMLLDLFVGLKECEPEIRNKIAEWLISVNRLIQEVILSILVMEKFARPHSWPRDVPTPIAHFHDLTGVDLRSDFWHHWKKIALHTLIEKTSSHARIMLHLLHDEIDPWTIKFIRQIRKTNFHALLNNIRERDPEVYHLFSRVESRHFSHGFNPFDAAILWNCTTNHRFAELLWQYGARYGRSYNAAVFLLQSICGIDITNRFWNLWRRHMAKRFATKQRGQGGSGKNLPEGE